MRSLSYPTGVLACIVSNVCLSLGYSLAHALYEDASDHPLSKELVRETVFAAAMAAYDNASNPNLTRGGLKKCIEM